jgi:hypothetical protein
MPRGRLSVITPPSTPTQRRYEVTKVPSSTKKPSSVAKQGQERDRSHRRKPKRSRPDRATSHGINSRSSDRYLDFANVQSLGHSRSGIKRYANDFIPDDSSEHTTPRDTDPNTASNQVLSVPGRDQASLPKSSDHAADTGATPGSTSDWKSTTYAATKLAINLVKESSDVFPPLGSVMGGLSAILDHCDVCSISPKPNDP